MNFIYDLLRNLFGFTYLATLTLPPLLLELHSLPSLNRSFHSIPPFPRFDPPFTLLLHSLNFHYLYPLTVSLTRGILPGSDTDFFGMGEKETRFELIEGTRDRGWEKTDRNRGSREMELNLGRRRGRGRGESSP